MQINKLIQNGESIILEFKKSVSEINAIIATISAFSNSKGGKIIIGITDNKTILGIQIGKGTIENITNQISQHTDPKVYPEIYSKKINEKEILIIDVKESTDHLTLAYGRPYKRIGKSTIKMSKDEYERSIIEKHNNQLSFDQQIYNKFKINNIDKDLLKTFIVESKKFRSIDISERMTIIEILERLKLVYHGKLTNASILLFSKNTSDFITQAIVKAIRFKGCDVTGEMIDFKTFEGNIITQLKKSEDFIMEHIPMQSWIENGKIERQEKWLYPPKAIREGLVNALVHRDYKSTSNIQIRIFDDRMEIWNPGSLPKNLTIEKLKSKHESIPKNPLVARMFFWIKYSEEIGTGTNKIIKWCKEWKLPEPKFEDTGTSFILTLKHSYNINNIPDKFNELNDRQKKAINYMIKFGSINRTEYIKINKISHTIAHKEFKNLLDKNIIKIDGAGKYLKYKLTQG